MRKHLPSLACVLTLNVLASPAFAQVGGTFQIDTQYVTGLANPTALAFAPDGRLFVAQQAGAVRVVTAGGQLLSTPLLTLPSVRSDQERGLLGLAFDPAFASNGYLYALYTPGNAAVTRLSRFTVSGNTASLGSESTIFEYGNYSGNHRGGDIHFGPDGKLYIALGDAGEPTNAQSVSSFDGKILRLNRDGSIPSDNPSGFRSTTGASLTPSGDYRAIWAIGLRNPYRFSFQGGTGAIRINDVGGGLWEEVNIGQAGANYGWPTCEGQCSNSYATNPLYVHTRGDDGCAITGGAFQSGSAFPTSFAGHYFVIDYCRTWLRHIRPDGSTATFPLAIPQFSVDLKFAPDGSLLVLGHGTGTISRITYTASGSNRNPAAQISANPTSGRAPLTVNFAATGSSDPDGDALTYAWDFGDGQAGTGATISHTYTASGSFSARVTVSDGRGGTDYRTLTIGVGTPPSATITTPVAGALYAAGDTISFAGSANDPEDGLLPATAFSWTVLLHHDVHTHPAVGPLTGVTSASITIPTTGHTEHTVFYRIYLTVTDASGLQTQVTRDVMPRKSQITIGSNVAGAEILLDGQPLTAPYTFTGVAGVQRALEVVSPQTVGGRRYTFSSWSDGGGRQHTVSTPLVDTTYTATLVDGGPAAAAAPALHWPFDNSLTEVVRNTPSSGRGSLSYSGDKAPVAPNAASLAFDGTAPTYLAVAGDGVLSGWTAATTAVWIKLGAATTAGWANGSSHSLLFKNGVLQIRLVKENGLVRLVAAHGDGSALGTAISSTATISIDRWVHLVTLHTGTSVSVFVDGQPAGSGTTGRTFGANSAASLDVVGYGGDLAALLDELRLYDRALSAADVAALSNAIPPPAAPTGLRIVR